MLAGKRIEPKDDSSIVAFDPSQVNTHRAMHRELTVLRCVNQLAVLLNEQASFVTEHFLVDERPLRLVFAPQVIERGPNCRHLQIVLTPKPAQDVQLEEINERQQMPRFIGGNNQSVSLTSAAGCRILRAEGPVMNRSKGDSEIAGRLYECIRRQLPRSVAVVSHFCGRQRAPSPEMYASLSPPRPAYHRPAMPELRGPDCEPKNAPNRILRYTPRPLHVLKP